MRKLSSKIVFAYFITVPFHLKSVRFDFAMTFFPQAYRDDDTTVNYAKAQEDAKVLLCVCVCLQIDVWRMVMV